MTVHVETRGARDADVADYEALLRSRLGVEIGVELEAPGALAALTQIESRQKPIRLIDNRRARHEFRDDSGARWPPRSTAARSIRPRWCRNRWTGSRRPTTNGMRSSRVTR